MIEKPPPQRTIHYAKGRYVIVLLDLLGQKEVMRQMDPLPQDPDALNQVVAKSLGMRSFMQDQIRQIFYEAFEKMESSDVDQLGKSEADLFRRIRPNMTIRSNQFADTVVYYALVTDECQFAAMVMSLFFAVGGALLACLAHGVPIRGAITSGEAIRTGDTDEIYGGPLVRAFDIEQAAGMPRVLVEPALVDKLKSITESVGTSFDQSCTRFLSNIAMSMTEVEEDKCISICYLSGPIRDSRISNSENYKDLYERAQRFVKGEAEKFASDTKLGPRYSLLLSHFARHP